MSSGVTSFSPARITGNGVNENRWTGSVQRLLGVREQYRAEWIFKTFLIDQEEEIHEFLDLLGEGENVFSAPWPGICPKGKARGQIQLDGDHASGAREIRLKGITGPFSKAFAAGDPLELGLHGTRVRKSTPSTAEGTATVQIWPRLPRSLSDGEAVTLHGARALWSVTSELSMPLLANYNRRQKISFTAQTEVIYEGHPILTP